MSSGPFEARRLCVEGAAARARLADLLERPVTFEAFPERLVAVICETGRSHGLEPLRVALRIACPSLPRGVALALARLTSAIVTHRIENGLGRAPAPRLNVILARGNGEIVLAIDDARACRPEPSRRLRLSGREALGAAAIGAVVEQEVDARGLRTAIRLLDRGGGGARSCDAWSG